MTDLTDNLDSFVGASYSAAKKTASLLTALRFATGKKQETVADNDSENSDLAVAMYAAEVLLNDRNHERRKSDNTVIVKSPEEMWTPFMNQLLFTNVAERSIILKNIDPSEFARGKRWQDG